MKALLQRNPLIVSIVVVALVVLAATGYAMAVDMGSHAAVVQAPPPLMMPF
jgi:hypothetical protein